MAVVLLFAELKMRFFYLIPAESHFRLCTENQWEHLRRICFQRHRRLPCGGVKVIYQHCDLLNQNGFEAYPVHLGNFTVDDWLEHTSKPLADHEARRLATPDDILVVPDRLPLAVESFPCRRKFAFVQNGGLVDKATAGKRYEDFGFSGILCCGNFVSEFMAAHSNLPRHVVTNGIRLDLFRPAPEKRKKNTLLYLRRKPSWPMGAQAVALLPRELQQELHIINLPNTHHEKEMAGFYQQADIFMALGFPEGFALPPLEAMACGCAVIGFTGGGGAEHMRDGETALVAPDGDVPVLSRTLRRIIEDDALKEKLRQGGMKKSREFGVERMQRELVAFARMAFDTTAR